MTIPTLAALKSKYFAPAFPTFDENSEFSLLVDGKEYFEAVDDAISATTGTTASATTDAILILGWTFGLALDLRNRAPGSTGHKDLGQLLVEKAAAGVDVRLVFNGALYLQRKNNTPFDLSFQAMVDLMRRTVGNTRPMSDRVLFDWSGARSGSHHQKAVVVRADQQVTAFVGGIDLIPNRYDTRVHDLADAAGARFGWHDAAVRIRGAATKPVWENFESRWNEARELGPMNFRQVSGSGGQTSLQYDPTPTSVAPPVPANLGTISRPGQSAQVLRSRWESRRPRAFGADIEWTGPPTGAIREIVQTYRRAISEAVNFIYIEDQFLADTRFTESGGNDLSLLPDLKGALERGVKLILVTSGLADPDDPPRVVMIKTDFTTELLVDLPPAAHGNLAIWSIDHATVHSKFCVIDDLFCGIGSANLHTRSMFGIDDELHVFLVDNGSGVGPSIKDWRVRMWAEHLRIPWPPPDTVKAALEDPDIALGMWRSSWSVTGPTDAWFVTNSPPGFAPDEIARTFVGPDPGP